MLEFRILGPLDVRDDGESVPVGGRRQRALLAILLLSANRVVSRERLISELWDGQPTAEADNTLNVQVSRLRKALGGDGAGRRVIATRPFGYELLVAPGAVDAERFEAHVAAGRAALAAGEITEAVRYLREADELWRGQPLVDVAEPFARAAGLRLEDLRLGAIEDRVEAELELGRHAALVPELEGLTAEHPLRDACVDN